jgi:1-acyl-sn-glycerol-3-phosphate acyltransferase
VVEILEPIPPGLPRDTFFAELQNRIEEASNRLLREGQAELGMPVTPSIETPSRA